MNDAFKALADPTRREILHLLRQHGELSAGGIAERFTLSKPALSHHFTILKNADLISFRRDGQTIWYSLNTTVMQDLIMSMYNLFSVNRPDPESPT